ncbi:uncharacterized protein LOC131955760 [Physella acuta]|uniref:uncharacterized protein LOC131955760 n=1 Tax=Physella acuta TaxID=109671 RepID=UPI0027DAC8AB|nr:uncharacterized protein LOC131955760 [Physella acuta]
MMWVKFTIKIMIASWVFLSVGANHSCDSEPCQPGYFCHQEKFICLDCPSGTFQPEIGRSPFCRNHTANPTGNHQSYHLLQAGTTTEDNIWELTNSNTSDIFNASPSEEVKQSQSNDNVIIITLPVIAVLIIIITGLVILIYCLLKKRVLRVDQQQHQAQEGVDLPLTQNNLEAASNS